MEQRREPRFRTGQTITLTLLGDKDTEVSARITNYSANGLGLELPFAVTPGTAVKITLEDAIMLGELVYSHPQGKLHYAGLHLEQTMTGLAELARIVQAFEDLQMQTSDPVRDRRQQHQP
jgi:hypothetical protein